MRILSAFLMLVLLVGMAFVTFSAVQPAMAYGDSCSQSCGDGSACSVTCPGRSAECFCTGEGGGSVQAVCSCGGKHIE